MEVDTDKHTQLCTLANNAKIETIDLFKKLTTKSSDWETTMMKLTLIEKVEIVLLKFFKSLINSLLIKHGQTKEDLNLINSKYHQASVLTTE